MSLVAYDDDDEELTGKDEPQLVEVAPNPLFVQLCEKLAQDPQYSFAERLTSTETFWRPNLAMFLSEECRLNPHGSRLPTELYDPQRAYVGKLMETQADIATAGESSEKKETTGQNYDESSTKVKVDDSSMAAKAERHTVERDEPEPSRPSRKRSRERDRRSHSRNRSEDRKHRLGSPKEREKEDDIPKHSKRKRS